MRSKALETNVAHELHPKQHAAITLLVQGRGYTETAEAVGIERKVLWQWRKDPAFRAALNAELASIRQAALVRLLALGEKAVDALEDVLENGETDGARIAAAKLVLERVGVASMEHARPEDATPTSPNDGKTIVLIEDLER
jgi:Helix-turn-helix of insertion element transposase